MTSIYFKNSNGVRSLISENVAKDDWYSCISEDVERRSKGKFKIFYYRSWTNPSNDKETIIDVGSHTEFYILVDE